MRVEDLFEKVTADLVAAIEAGASGWRMPWHSLSVTPRNVDGRPYRGWNQLVLGMTAAERGWCGVFATYKGWQRHGGQVRRGERATTVVLWKPVDARGDNDDDGDDSRVGSAGRGLVARSFSVFALEQVDGATIALPSAPCIEVLERVDAAEQFFVRVGADVRVGGDRACYRPGDDVICLPGRDRFARVEDFYATSAHEHVHWTGHLSRLARDLSGRFGDRAYGAEELVAELGAAFWCAQFGMAQVTRDDHAAYLADWLRLLRADTRALVSACSHAQHAVDHLNVLSGHIVTV
jgi:antirestriction protein ArdC